ncbi:hypothetical protein D9M70_629290 [compost metagenome]
MRLPIQRGISAPQASEKRRNWAKLEIGMMPGMIGISTPSLRTASTKWKYASGL